MVPEGPPARNDPNGAWRDVDRHRDDASMQTSWLEHLENLLDTELATGSADSPFRPSILRWAAENGRHVDAAQFLTTLEDGQIGGRGGPRRYRWSFPVARWIPLEELVAWRPLEAERAERNPTDHAARLWTPPILVEHMEWLEDAVHGGDGDVARRARALLDEAMPTLEDDVARHVEGQDAWADTFMLWVLARRPRALTRLRGLAAAIASRYDLRAARSGGLVVGRNFPFFETAMPSATAHLASAAARIGEGIDVVAPSIAWLKKERNRDGGWGDPRQASDLLTTLAVGELMGSLDPSFDPTEVRDVLGALAGLRGGRPTLIGPEWSWVAGELLSYAAWSERPFKDRFRWPHVPGGMIDEKTAVPRIDGFSAYARLFNRVPGLAATPVDLAFIDLANFGKWNKANGQQAGDELLGWLAAVLRSLPESRTVRDGGDEFLVIGTPGASGLEQRLRALSTGWPEAARAHAPRLPVVPLRALVTTTTAGELSEAREALGKQIGPLRNANRIPPPEGVVERFHE